MSITYDSSTDNETNKLIRHLSILTPSNVEFKSKTDLNVILDLDETCVHTWEENPPPEVVSKLRSYTDLRTRLFEFKVTDPGLPPNEASYKIWGITRPHLQIFIIFCFYFFRNVVIWSAGQPRYVRAIVDKIFKDIFPPLTVYTSDETEMYDNGNVCKPLSKLFEDRRLINCNINERNTIIIDDNIETFKLNKSNAILIKEFSPGISHEELTTDDPAFPMIISWLWNVDVINCKDIRMLDKSNIFKRRYDLNFLKDYKPAESKFSRVWVEMFKIVSTFKA